MNTKPRYTLGKNERLKSRKAIEHLFTKGKSFSLFPLRVVYDFKHAVPVQGKPQSAIANPQSSIIRAGFSVSTKYFKKAVDRNRIKRLLRETYRLQKNNLSENTFAAQKQMNIFFIYTGNELPEYNNLFEKMGKAIKRLIKEIHAGTENDT